MGRGAHWRLLAIGQNLGLGDVVRVMEMDQGVEGVDHFLNGGVWEAQVRGVKGASWVHWSRESGS